MIPVAACFGLALFQNFTYSTSPSVTPILTHPERTYDTTPAGSFAADFSIRDHVVDLIDKAVPKSVIRGSIYDATDTTVSDALGAAKDRGVDVEIVLDNTLAGSKFERKLIAAIGANNVTTCSQGACIAIHANNHNKFFIFSEVKANDKTNDRTTVKNVALQASSNLTQGQYHEFQDALIITADPSAYAHYLKYFNDLKAQKHTDDYNLVTSSSSNPIVIYSFPNDENNNGVDPMIDTLKKMDSCVKGESAVYVGGSNFFANRADAVTDQMKRLHDAGCDIGWYLRDPSTGEDTGFAHIKALGLDNFVTMIEPGMVNNHSKMMMVDAYSGGKRKQVVVMGSANFGFGSVHNNDDSEVVVANPTVFYEYKAHFQRMVGDHLVRRFHCETSNVAGVDGCSSKAYCPDGYEIDQIKAVCNLEVDWTTLNQVDSLPFGQMSVIRASNSQSQGVCTVGPNKSSVEGVSALKNTAVTSLTYGCSDHDKHSGGDCSVRVALTCKPIAPRAPASTATPIPTATPTPTPKPMPTAKPTPAPVPPAHDGGGAGERTPGRQLSF